MRPAHRRQLHQLVSVQSPVVGTLDAYARPTWGTATQRAARVEPQNDLFDNADGTKLVTDWLVIVEAEIKYTDRVWLPPDGDVLASLSVARANIPKKIFRRINENGTTSHFEVHL
jgi:hypothetical protein